MSEQTTETPEAVAAWEAYQAAAPTRGDIEASALRNAWFDGRAFGLIEGALAVAQPAGAAYAQGIERGRTEERERCARIARNNMNEWNTAGWEACAEEILREIENG